MSQDRDLAPVAGIGIILLMAILLVAEFRGYGAISVDKYRLFLLAGIGLAGGGQLLSRRLRRDGATTGESNHE